MSVYPVLAVIPARGGSRGLPNKNIAILAGLPLIAHSIRLSKLCTEITSCIVSTDSNEIAAVARDYGAEVPFLRPAVLAQDDTPMWPVIRHALVEMEKRERLQYGSVLLLSPTSPGRLPEDVSRAIHLLEEDTSAVGVVAASRPSFNPRWVCIDLAADGYSNTEIIKALSIPLNVWNRRLREEPQFREMINRTRVSVKSDILRAQRTQALAGKVGPARMLLELLDKALP